jgi:hypothetical protein
MARVQLRVESSSFVSSEIDDNIEPANPASILFHNDKKNPTGGLPHHQRINNAGGRVFVNWIKSLCVRQKVCGGEGLRTSTFKRCGRRAGSERTTSLQKVRHVQQVLQLLCRHVPDDYTMVSQVVVSKVARITPMEVCPWGGCFRILGRCQSRFCFCFCWSQAQDEKLDWVVPCFVGDDNGKERGTGTRSNRGVMINWHMQRIHIKRIMYRWDG